MADRNKSPQRGRTPSIKASPTPSSPPRGKRTPSPSKKSPTPSRKTSPSQKRRTSPSVKSADKNRKLSPKGKKTPQKESKPKTPPSRKSSSLKSQRSTPQKTPDLTEKGLKVVDMSGQGMTSVPASLLTARDIGELCLASNNLRSLPLDIRRLTHLTKLDLSRNGIRCTSPQDFGGLPSEMEQLTGLEELKISECNLPFVPPAIWRLISLRFLDISRNKINVLLPDIGNLTRLQRLNLQQTNISSLPPEIAFCQDLEDILLWGNSIESLPETLPEMPKLRIMAINYRSFCGVVDDYMENLLRKGQIKSEHIPVVVFELPSLECLDLESTKLNNLPDVYNLALKEFYLCRNFLQTIPTSIYNLKYLSVLDLSNNLMLNLPEDIGRLRSLQILRVSQNMFEKVPPTIGLLGNLEELNMAGNRIRRLPPEIRGLFKLKTLVLAQNDIQSLPNEICDLTELETLDLTDNSIRQLPMKLFQLSKLKVAHSYRKYKKYGLWLYKNPLEQPPPQVWRTEKPEHIYDYLKKLAIIKTENLQRQKILLLGASQSGKTCLANLLALKKSSLTEGLDDRTRVLQTMLWKTENNVEFMLYDFGGDDTYLITTPLFLDSKALVLLVYNCASFTEEDYHGAIGQWIDLLNTQAPGAVVKIIASQCDLLQTSQQLLDLEKTQKSESEELPKEETGTKEEESIKDDVTTKVNAVTEDEEDEKGGTKTDESVKTEQEVAETETTAAGNDQEPIRESNNGKETDGVTQQDTARSEADQDQKDCEKNAGRAVSGRPVTNTPAENTYARYVVNTAQSQLKNYMKGVTDELNRVLSEKAKVEKSLNRTSSDPANDVAEAALKLLRVRQNKLEEVRGCPVRILPDVSVISSSDSLEGIADLVDEIEHLAIDKDLFPHAQRSIPGHWDRLCGTLKKKRSLYLLWDEVEEMAQTFRLQGKELKDCIHYLHDVGDVLWYEDVTGLSEIVFHCPLKLVDILASLYRHDITEFMDFTKNKIFSSKGGLTEEEFEDVRESFHKHGQVCRPLLNSFWFYQKMDNLMIEDLLELLPLLDLCYAVPEPDIPSCRLFCRPLMVLPWYNTDTSDKDIGELWRKIPLHNEKELTVIYSFPLYFPVGLFQKMSASIQDLVLSRTDWSDAVFATAYNEQVLMKKYEHGKGHLVKIFVRGLEFSAIEELMKEFVQVINSMLIRYPGLYWTLDIPMKNMRFLSVVAKSPTVQFELTKTPDV
ncbi:malignant fibrous histiocytoma-amplified sequence 1 homolog [Haliotis cracherodii]|uniref:malignant fibrous histiocytoma-amplified sequence 1 homolog n=1 Tax=Haliotis cracherodii TaxID=6455 RepID=UPI0039ECFC71